MYVAATARSSAGTPIQPDISPRTYDWSEHTTFFPARSAGVTHSRSASSSSARIMADHASPSGRRSDLYCERSAMSITTPKSSSPLSSFSITEGASPLKKWNFTLGCIRLTFSAARTTYLITGVSPPPMNTSPLTSLAGVLTSANVLP